MKIQFFIFLCLIFLLASCKKKDLPVIAPEIEIGNTQGMMVNLIDSNIAGSNFTLGEFYYDVNNDGENDILFNLRYSYSPGGGSHGYQKMTLLNNKISLLGNAFDDTVFIKFDTTVLNFGFGNKYVNRYRRFYFTRMGSNDSIASLNHYPHKAYQYRVGNIIKQADNASNVETILHDDNVDMNDSTIKTYTSNDTTFVHYINEKINENPYPMNTDIYFGFKFNDGKSSRLGWIKLKIISKGSTHLYEIAIQKN